MGIREQIVKEAREWKGTRWQHQCSVKGVATDCLGLVRGVAINCNLLPPDFWLTQAVPYHGYGHQPAKELTEGLGKYCQKISFEEAKIADVVLMVFDGKPTHVAILADYPDGQAIIHAYAQDRKVSECRLDASWRSRIVWAYRLPGVAP